MRLGTNFVPEHRSPEEWADIMVREGFRCAAFPVDYKEELRVIDAYAQAAKDRDILIAEVGAWCTPYHPDPRKAAEAKERCLEQLRLADYIKANCCVNLTGAVGPVFLACYPGNFAPEMYEKNVEFIRWLLDTAKPKNTWYTLEPMQWMIPDSAEQYLQFMKDVDRERLAVHMDMVNLVKDPYLYTHQDELIDKTMDMLGPYIRSSHLKDCLLVSTASVMIKEVPLGEGIFPARHYLERLSELPGDMPVILEHLPDLETYRKAAAEARRVFDWGV